MLRILTVLMILGVVLAGCAPASETPGEGPTLAPTLPAPDATLDPAGGTVPTAAEADITGNISDIQAGTGDRLGTLLVEGEKVDGNNYDRASVAVTVDTALMELTEAGAVPVAFEALQVGDTVSVTFVGPVAESYPVQAIAGSVVLLARMPQQ